MEVRTRQQTIRPGYKQTQVGVIPEDWEIKTLGGLTILLTNGFVGRATDFYVESDDGVLYVQGYNVQENGFNLHGICRVSKQFHAAHQKSCLETGDLLTIQTGDIGVTTIVPPALAGANCHALVISRLRKEQSEPAFYCHYFNSDRGKIAFREIETGSTMKHLNVGDMVDLPLPCPSVPEQRAIAAALSDVDVLIASLDKLIVKKSDLKQAAMQQLLTGKRRLPGFTGKWGVKRLREECGLITKGTTPTSLGKDFTSSGINFIKIETLEENGSVIKDKVAFIDEETNNLLKRSQLAERDILVSIAGALGRIAIVKADILPANTNQALAIVRLKAFSKIDHRFLFYYLNTATIKKHIEGINVQAAQANLSLKNVGDFIVSFPSLPEQVAIADVLSDMDSEIAAMENRRDKTRALKQGMMQELLTGKTRLI
jgi:type I restriction enzyme S subunit